MEMLLVIATVFVLAAIITVVKNTAEKMVQEIFTRLAVVVGVDIEPVEVDLPKVGRNVRVAGGIKGMTTIAEIIAAESLSVGPGSGRVEEGRARSFVGPTIVHSTKLRELDSNQDVLEVGDRIADLDGVKGTVVRVEYRDWHWLDEADKHRYTIQWDRGWWISKNSSLRKELILVQKQPHKQEAKRKAMEALASKAKRNMVFQDIFGADELIYNGLMDQLHGDDYEHMHVGNTEGHRKAMGYDDKNDGFLRTIHSRSKNNHSRNTKRGKVKRVKPNHKQYDMSWIAEDVWED